MARIDITEEAAYDLEGTWAYIAHHSEPAARRFIGRILKKLELLAEQPGVGRSRQELGRGFRSYPVRKYLIFYRRVDDGVQVIRVVHGARDLERLFERPDETEL
ncbi:MAG TPA: type II toxin-antitoxin system RelE/ParE family toxin [Phycisphaerae bacterium]